METAATVPFCGSLFTGLLRLQRMAHARLSASVPAIFFVLPRKMKGTAGAVENQGTRELQSSIYLSAYECGAETSNFIASFRIYGELHSAE